MNIQKPVLLLGRLLLGGVAVCITGFFLYILASLLIVVLALVLEFFGGPVDGNEVERIADVAIPENILVLRNESDYNFQSSSVHYDIRFLDEMSAEGMVDSILQSKSTFLT
ncbi:hypothetical protein IPG41_01345 [Candidatus Peregrinibacteria bacterium]|nr:MAG: hypothetical protein IPG41_01345 [Candidatus Peregrinibacteria bacterium]